MPVDKLLAAQSAMASMYGATILADSKKASETFYGQTAPAKSEQGVGKWLGFSNLIMGAMSGVMATADLKPNDQKKVKALMAAGSVAGAAMALHQVDANGFDKTQTKVAVGANMLFGAAAIKDIIDLSK